MDIDPTKLQKTTFPDAFRQHSEAHLPSQQKSSCYENTGVSHMGSDTDSENERGASGPSTEKKLRTEIVHKKCVTTYSRQDFKSSETQSTDDESRRGSPLQIIGDIVIEHDNNQMEVYDQNPTTDHVQKPRQIIGVSTRQSSQWSQDFIVEPGHNQDQLNTRHIVNVIVNKKKKESQQKYRERNREKLKQREAERRKRIRNLQFIPEPSTSSNMNRIELSNEEITDANTQSLSGSEGTQTSSVQDHKQAENKRAFQKKKEYQRKYRERNREKLKQREAERRKRIQNLQFIPEPSTSSNMNRIELNNEEITYANTQSLSGSEGTQTSSVQDHEQAENKRAFQKKKEYQRKYRERNREKLKQREAERRKRIQNLQFIPEPSTSSNMNRIELNNEEITYANTQSLSGSEGTQTSSVQDHEQAENKRAFQKKKEYQRKYRERNREKLKQREAERRKRIQNLQFIPEPSTSSNMNRIELNKEEITYANTQSLSGSEGTQTSSVQDHEQNERDQSSATEPQFSNNHSAFRFHKFAHKYFNDHFEKDLQKTTENANVLNTITDKKAPKVVIKAEPYYEVPAIKQELDVEYTYPWQGYEASEIVFKEEMDIDPTMLQKTTFPDVFQQHSEAHLPSQQKSSCYENTGVSHMVSDHSKQQAETKEAKFEISSFDANAMLYSNAKGDERTKPSQPFHNHTANEATSIRAEDKFQCANCAKSFSECHCKTVPSESTTNVVYETGHRTKTKDQ